MKTSNAWMWMMIAVATLACPAFAASASRAQAQNGQLGAKQAPDKVVDESPSDAQKRTHTPRQVSGIVLGTKSVELRGTGQRNLIVLLKTAQGDRRLAVDLGPAQALQQANITPGARIAAEGYVVVLRDQQFLVATRVKITDGTIIDITRAEQMRLHRSQGVAQPAVPQQQPRPSGAVPSPQPLPVGPLPGEPSQHQPGGSY